MQFQLFTVNPFSQNTYLVHNENEAWLIDVGFYEKAELNAFYDYLTVHHLQLKAIFLTHAHIDHVFGINDILKTHKVPVFLNSEDKILLDNVQNQAALYGFSIDPITVSVQELTEQTVFQLGSFSAQTLFTPGHAPGHISFFFPDEKVLIAGDTLFAGSIGRMDLYKGSFEELEESIRKKLYTLPDDTRVLSGHGLETTIGQEKRTNPYIRA